MRCRDTLGRLLAAIDSDGNEVQFPTPSPQQLIEDLAGNTATFTPESLSLSPSGAWTWQPELMDAGLFSSEASLGLAMGASAMGYDSQMSDAMQNPTATASETWDLARGYDSVS